MNQSPLQSKNFSDDASSRSAFLPAPHRMHRRLRPHPAARIEQSLSALPQEFKLSASTRFRIFVTGRPTELDSAMHEQIYLIAREALLNALRHSGATNIEAEIEYLHDKFRVVVRDNGCGIDPQALARESHRGLVAMREHAAEIGARLRVWSKQRAGTEVEICVPSQAQRFLA